MLIEGHSSGFTMGVTSNGRAQVESKSRPSEEVEAERGEAFIIHAECHTAAAASGGLLSITNTSSTEDIIITRIYIDPHVITPTDLIVFQVKNPVVVAGTDVSSTAIVNKNFGSGKTMDATILISDGSADLTYTGGDNYHAFPITSMSPLQRNMMGTNIITPNKTILFGWATDLGGNATDAEHISLSVNCFKRSTL